jgi:ABC-type polysaccharide/polyol phosphate export permease
VSDDTDIGVGDALQPGTPGEAIAPFGSHPDAADTGLEEIEDQLAAEDAAERREHDADAAEHANDAHEDPLAQFPVPVLAEKPPSQWRYRRAFHMGEALVALWRSWQIIWGLAVRQLRTTYSQQVFGLAWTVLTPVAQMVIFTFLLHRATRGTSKQLIQTGGVPLAVWMYVGLLIWGFYSSAVSSAGNSLVGNPLLNKVYAPREVFPIAQVATSGFDAVVSAIILPILLLITHEGLTWSTAWASALPILMITLYATAISLVVSAITVYARDLRSGLPILMSLGMFMPGILYPVTTFWTSVKIQSIYAVIFPVGALSDSIRKAWLQGVMPHGQPFWIATVASCVYLAICYSAFKRMETGFADVS